MKLLRSFLDRQAHRFEKGGKLEKLAPIFEATDTFLYTPGEVTRTAPHARDAIDLKRLMSVVYVALIPCMLMAMYNTGLQTHLAIQAGAAPLEDWRTAVFRSLGFEFAPYDVLACFVHGALYFLPVYLVTLAAGGIIETIFAMVRGHEINEGFLVTSILFPLTLPATVPLWQVALGIVFGVLLGKEIFGGTGRNIWNPALTGRVFLYFAYPVELSGDAVWIPAKTGPDVWSGATWLAVIKDHGESALREGVEGLSNGPVGLWDAFIGFIPGSMGETSALFCLLGAILIVVTGVASWRIIAGVVAGSFLTIQVFNWIGPDANPMFDVPFYWHFVLGSFAFATAFMATDPVSAPYTDAARWIYGLLIGALGMVIRVLNPAYAESWMLAILFMNTFAALLDYFVIQSNVKRRLARYEA